MKASRGLWPAVAAMVVLFGGGLLGAVRTSVTTFRGELTFAPWRDVLRDPVLVDATVFTLMVMLVVVLVGAPLAVATAALVRRSRPARIGMTLPVLLPHLLVAVVAVFWLAPGGLADRLLGGLPIQLVRDRAGLGIIGVYLFKEVPFLVLLLTAAWDVEVEERDEAARSLGASPWQRVRWVLWPALRTPLAVGSLIVGAFVLGSFEVPLVIGPSFPPTLATFALDQTRVASLAGQSRAAAVLLLSATGSLVLAAIALRTARAADDTGNDVEVMP